VITISARPAPARCIDNEDNLSRLNQVDCVYAVIVPDLADYLRYRYSILNQGSGCTRCGDNSESKLSKAMGSDQSLALIAICEGEKDSPGVWESVTRRGLALPEGKPEGSVDPHYLARGSHLGSEHSIDRRETIKRKHCLLYRDVPAI